MPYNVRKSIGKNKTRFITKKAKNKLIKMVEATVKARKKCIDDKSEEKESKSIVKIQEKNKYDTSSTYLGGRKVIEWDKLADDLWCYKCNDSLSMRFVTEEKQLGIVSKFKIRCHRCQTLSTVDTSIKSTKHTHDANLKLAVGMLDAAMGETTANTFISGLNIPPINHNSLKCYERYVGAAAEELANEACIEAIAQEKLLCKQNKENNIQIKQEVDIDGEEITDFTASFDGAWVKKGRQRNSLSGHSSLIGNFSKKIIAYACRNLYCRSCNTNKPHNCKKNHTGSSKDMEADMAVEFVLKNDNLTNAKCRIKTIIGDDDSSAIAALRSLYPYTIIKLSDYNHVKKTFNSKLYEINLLASVREYFSKVFCLAIKKNKGDEEKVKLALKNIVPHAFGDHANCDTSFCIRTDDGSCTYKYFKDGVCLTDGNLKDKLEKILQPFINSSAQITPCAFSQANESFNHTVCSKHPKSQFYGGSESHCFRVAIAVCQKNLGYEYIIKLNERLNVLPGKYTQAFRKRKQYVFSTNADRKKKFLQREGV